MILYLDDFLILGSTYQEAQSHTAFAGKPPGKPRLHCQSGKVMSDSDPNDNIPGLCNRLHCRSTGERCKCEIPLLEGKGISNYACSSNSQCTRHSRVVSPSNLASSPSFSILANQNDPSSTFKQPELRCAYYSGSPLFGRTSVVGVQHRLCEWQPHKTSRSNVVYNNKRIQDSLGPVCENQRANGRWSDSERTQHINVLELKAAFLALKSFLKNQSQRWYA